MIESLRLENFQSHKKTELEFTAGVNAIVGPSDSGKSSILRALRWIITNRPLGDSMRSYWGGDTKAVMTTEQGEIISRIRDKSNRYVISGQDLKAFGSAPPEQVVEALAMDEVVNIQQQLDRPFLLDESPGAIASFFNSIAHLDKIDSSVSCVQKSIRGLNQEITIAETSLEKLETDLDGYSHLLAFEADLNMLDEMNTRAVATSKQAAGLEITLQELSGLSQEEQQYQDEIKAEPGVVKALGLIEELEELEEQKDQLASLVSRIDAVSTTQYHEKSRLAEQEKEFKSIFPNICPLCGQEVKK